MKSPLQTYLDYHKINQDASMLDKSQSTMILKKLQDDINSMYGHENLYLYSKAYAELQQLYNIGNNL